MSQLVPILSYESKIYKHHWDFEKNWESVRNSNWTSQLHHCQLLQADKSTSCVFFLSRMPRYNVLSKLVSIKIEGFVKTTWVTKLNAPILIKGSLPWDIIDEIVRSISEFPIFKFSFWSRENFLSRSCKMPS